MLTSTHKVLAARRSACRRNGTAATSGQPGARPVRARRASPSTLAPDDWTTATVAAGAMALLRVAQPFTVGPLCGNESAGEFISRAVAERVVRLKVEKGFVLPAGLSVEFPFTVPK